MRIFVAVLLLLPLFSGCMEYTIAAPFSLAPHGWQEMGVLEADMDNADLTNIQAAFDGAGRLYCAYELPGDGIQVKRLRSGRWEALSATTSPAPDCSNMQFVVTEGGTPFVACGSNNYIIIRRCDGNIWREDTNFQHTGWKTLALGFDYEKNVVLAYKDSVPDIMIRVQTNWGSSNYVTNNSPNYAALQLLSSATYGIMLYATGPGVPAMVFATTNTIVGWNQFPDDAVTNGQALVDNYGKVVVAVLGEGSGVVRFRGAIPGSTSWMDETILAIPNVNAFRMAQYRPGSPMYLGVRTFNTPPVPDEAVTLYAANPWRQYSDPMNSPIVYGYALAVSPSGEVWLVAVVWNRDVGGSTYYDLRAWRYRP